MSANPTFTSLPPNVTPATAAALATAGAAGTVATTTSVSSFVTKVVDQSSMILDRLVHWIRANPLLTGGILASIAAIIGTTFWLNNSRRRIASEKLNTPPMTASSARTTENGVKTDELVAKVKSSKATDASASSQTVSDGFRVKGNAAFKAGKYADAIAFYTSGIESPDASEKTLSFLYHNRGTSHFYLGDLEQCVADTSMALTLSPLYIRALRRRMTAYTELKKFNLAAVDCLILSHMEPANMDSIIQQCEALCQRMAASEVDDIIASRKARVPSYFTVRNYLDSFHNNIYATYPTLADGEEPASADSTDGDHLFRTAIHLLHQGEYDESFDTIHLAIANNTQHLGKAYNLRGTFYFLAGLAPEALADIDRSIELEPTSSAYIRRASINSEIDGHDVAFLDLDKGKQLDPTDSDLYLHTAQLNLLRNSLDKALEDFDMIIAKGEASYVAYLQRFTAMQAMASSMDEIISLQNQFESVLAKFPHVPDLVFHFVESLANMQRFDEAEKFLREGQKRFKDFPLFYIAEANLIFSRFITASANSNGGQPDVGAFPAEDRATVVGLLEKALELDPRNDMAMLLLAQHYSSSTSGNPEDISRAIGYYNQALDCVRLRAEMIHVLTARHNLEVQSKALDYFRTHIVPNMNKLTEAQD